MIKNNKIQAEMMRKLRPIFGLLRLLVAKVLDFNYILITSYKDNDGSYVFNRSYKVGNISRGNGLDQQYTKVMQEVFDQENFIVDARKCEQIVVCVNNENIPDGIETLETDKFYKIINIQIQGSFIMYCLEGKKDKNNTHYFYNSKRFVRMHPPERMN